MKVILLPNLCRDGDLSYTRRAKALLEEKGAETAVCLPFPPKGAYRPPQDMTFRDLEESVPNADMMITFGGDGTILYASKAASAAGIPVLGVNLGRLGFMAGVEPESLEQLERLLTGDYKVEEHMLLRIQVFRQNELIYENTVLNDAVISRIDFNRTVDLDIWFDGVSMPRVSGDGLVVATPTGSTAYSLSAGGPVVEHTSRCMIITAVCPHSLGMRPNVIRPDRLVNVRLLQHSDAGAALLADGQRCLALCGGDVIQLGVAPKTFSLIRLQNRNFYRVLTTKLIR